MKTKILVSIALLSSLTAFSQKEWTLKECVTHALANNTTIQQNRLQVAVAEKDVAIAKGNFLPSLNASSGGNFGFGSTIHPVTNDRVSTTTFGNSMNLNSGMTIFNGFQNVYRYQKSQIDAAGSKLDLKKIEDDIALNVVNYYLNVLFAKENLKVAQVQYQISEQQIENARIKFEGGVLPKGDLLNAQSKAATDAQTLVMQENTLDLALLNLAQVLQVSSVNFQIAPLSVTTPTVVFLYNTAEEVYAKAVQNRPEIQRAQLAIESANLSVKIAKGAYLPSVSASASAATNFGHSFDLLPGQAGNVYFSKQLKDNLGYGVGVTVNIPIFNRFQTKNNVAKSVIYREMSDISLIQQKLQLQQTIEQAFLDAKAAARTYETAKVSLSAQQEALKNAQERYNFGAMTLFDFENVRTRLVNAEAVLIRSKYDYVFKTKVLQFYFGESIIE